MTSPSGGAGDVADALLAVLTQPSRAAFERALAADVRWGGGDDDERTCHTRHQAGEAFAALLERGTQLSVLSTRVGNDQILARLQVRVDDSGESDYESQVLLTVRGGVVIEILQLDEDEPPVIELLYFAGCPHYEAFLPHLQELLRRHEVPSPVQLVHVDDDYSARQLRFLGSPSLRINGKDIEPGADQRNDYGMQCRLFDTADGQAGTPPDAWILTALQV